MFFPARPGNRFSASGLVSEPDRAAGLRRDTAMAEQLQHWRSGNGETAWLAALVETMETVSGPELRALPRDRALLAAVEAHLAGPAIPHALYGSDFSLRN